MHVCIVYVLDVCERVDRVHLASTLMRAHRRLILLSAFKMKPGAHSAVGGCPQMCFFRCQVTECEDYLSACLWGFQTKAVPAGPPLPWGRTIKHAIKHTEQHTQPNERGISQPI